MHFLNPEYPKYEGTLNFSYNKMIRYNFLDVFQYLYMNTCVDVLINLEKVSVKQDE